MNVARLRAPMQNDFTDYFLKLMGAKGICKIIDLKRDNL